MTLYLQRLVPNFCRMNFRKFPAARVKGFRAIGEARLNTSKATLQLATRISDSVQHGCRISIRHILGLAAAIAGGSKKIVASKLQKNSNRAGNSESPQSFLIVRLTSLYLTKLIYLLPQCRISLQIEIRCRARCPKFRELTIDIISSK